MIKHLYKVTVSIPNDVVSKWYFTKEYGLKVSTLTANAIERDSGPYLFGLDEGKETAVFDDFEQAKACEEGLISVMEYFMAKRAD